MTLRAELAVSLLLLFPGAARAADAPAAAASTLDALSRDLLTGNGYELRDDGKAWDKIADTPVSSADMPGLLSRLAGARRLKTLLQLNVIFGRYDDERHLSDDDREAVRGLARQNWAVLNSSTRRDFRAYFSPEERESLDKVPLYASPAVGDMKDPAVDSITSAPPLPPASVTAAPPTASSATAVAASTGTGKFVIAAPIAAARTLTLGPTTYTFASGSTSTATALKPTDLTLGMLKPWSPPIVSISTAARAVAASTAAVKVEKAEPALPQIGAADYDKFVEEGPYAAEDKELLRLIGKKAPEFCLPLLRRTVVLAVPQISLDGARTGTGLRAGLVRGAPDAPPIVALSPGPVFIEVKTGLFTRDVLLLPEDPKVWAELGLPAPRLLALSSDAPVMEPQGGPWGVTRRYADGSRRGTYSMQERAGELLEQLLTVGLEREAFAASPYAARRWTRTVRLLFEARLKKEIGTDAFLDPDRRAELRDWTEHPDELDDLLVASWSAARVGTLDARRAATGAARVFEPGEKSACARAALEDKLAEAARRRARRVGLLEGLLDAGLINAAAAKPAAQSAANDEETERRRLLAAPAVCPAIDPAQGEALRRAAKLLGEATRAEASWRERGEEANAHASR